LNFSKEQLEKALAEFQAFGPPRRVPVEERWRSVLPEVDPGEFGNLKEACAAVEAFALELAERASDGRITDAHARQQLQEKYPLLTEERLNRTWSQAMYFSRK